MAENLYEGMFVLDSGKFSSDPDGTTRHVLDILAKAGAEVVAHRPWQDGRLAHEIERQRKALHYLALFRMHGGGGLKDIGRACKLSDTVLRHMIIKQPESLFEAMVDALTGNDRTVEPGDRDHSADSKDEESDDEDSDDEDNKDIAVREGAADTAN